MVFSASVFALLDENFPSKSGFPTTFRQTKIWGTQSPVVLFCSFRSPSLTPQLWIQCDAALLLLLLLWLLCIRPTWSTSQLARSDCRTDCIQRADIVVIYCNYRCCTSADPIGSRPSCVHMHRLMPI